MYFLFKYIAIEGSSGTLYQAGGKVGLAAIIKQGNQLARNLGKEEVVHHLRQGLGFPIFRDNAKKLPLQCFLFLYKFCFHI